MSRRVKECMATPLGPCEPVSVQSAGGGKEAEVPTAPGQQPTGTNEPPAGGPAPSQGPRCIPLQVSFPGKNEQGVTHSSVGPALSEQPQGPSGRRWIRCE